jgi:hypothetical protein
LAFPQQDQRSAVRGTKRRLDEVEEKPKPQEGGAEDDLAYYDDEVYEKSVEVLKIQERIAELEFERAKRRRMKPSQ